jgi:LacI family transcriptional regulator
VILIPFNTSSNVPILNGLLSKAPRKLGRSIPHDVAVVSFDNQELIAAHLHPPLSTLELPTTRWVSGPFTKEAPIDLTGLNEAKLQCVVHWSIPSN